MTTRWNEQEQLWETTARGREVLADPRLNRGTAFTPDERDELGLTGLIPPRVLTLDQQAARAYSQYSEFPTDLTRNVYLTALHDRNEVLFYRVIGDHLAEMLPIVYTPTIGTAIERYSHEYRRPRGAYLSVDQPDAVEQALRNTGHSSETLDIIVVTDAQAILGIGDWGTGGIDIAAGKLAVYTAAGVDPARTLPVMLDVGTSREELLNDPLYLGNRHPRVAEPVYDAFIDQFAATAWKLFPRALVHWEDFGAANARRILSRYQDRLTFNDDMQGTGAVSLAAVLAAVPVTGTPLREHRVVIYGAGTAGTGIADQIKDAMIADGLTAGEAARQFWCIDRSGLLTDRTPGLTGPQQLYARPWAETAAWPGDPRPDGGISLLQVVRQAKPTILIGTSGQAGAFTESVVREMARHAERPVILPLSNPTALAEAAPADLLAWTGGKALVATGSPFAPVVFDGVRYDIGQANNALVFPGLGLGAIVAGARQITTAMLAAAARAVAATPGDHRPGEPLLPVVDELGPVSQRVARAVVRAAQTDGVADRPISDDQVAAAVARATWTPRYRPIRPI